MVDCADLIKAAVPMDAILRHYGLLTRTQTHRVPCPLHGGEKNNFSFRDHRFKCFVCGEHGTTIDFVMKYRGLGFVEAMEEINDSFGLDLPIRAEREQTEADRRAREMAERIRIERKRRQDRLKQLLTAYDAAMDKYAALDIIAQETAPKGPYDEISDLYAYAVKHIDAAWEEVQDAAAAIRRFEKEGDDA